MTTVARYPKCASVTPDRSTAVAATGWPDNLATVVRFQEPGGVYWFAVRYGRRLSRKAQPGSDAGRIGPPCEPGVAWAGSWLGEVGCGSPGNVHRGGCAVCVGILAPAAMCLGVNGVCLSVNLMCLGVKKRPSVCAWP